MCPLQRGFFSIVSFIQCPLSEVLLYRLMYESTERGILAKECAGV